MTSATMVSEASNTSSRIVRSSLVRFVFELTSTRSSSSETSDSVSFGSKPSSRTMPFVFLPMSQMIGRHTFANALIAGTTARAICSLRCMAMRFGTISEITIEQYEMTSVSTMVVSGAATLFGTPQPSTTGTMNGEIDDSPKEAERKPESVTPICTVDRNVFGSRAIFATRLPRASSCSIWSICEPRSETSASSVPANTEPSSRKTKMSRMFKPSDIASSVCHWHANVFANVKRSRANGTFWYGSRYFRISDCEVGLFSVSTAKSLFIKQVLELLSNKRGWVAHIAPDAHLTIEDT